MTTPRARALAGTVLMLAAAVGLAMQRTAEAQSSPQTAPSGSAPLYVIGRGDELSIKVLGRPELEDTVLVRSDGRISALLLDDVEAAGLTTAALNEALATRYAKFFRDPQVSLVVRRMASLQVAVGGEVAQPGVLPINGQLTALTAVYQAGGFKRSARTDSVVLLRDAHGAKPATMVLNLKDLRRSDSATVLEPHDVIFVPASRIAKVDNFVDQYMRQLIPISATAGFSYLLGHGLDVNTK